MFLGVRVSGVWSRTRRLVDMSRGGRMRVDFVGDGLVVGREVAYPLSEIRYIYSFLFVSARGSLGRILRIEVSVVAAS